MRRVDRLRERGASEASGGGAAASFGAIDRRDFLRRASLGLAVGLVGVGGDAPRDGSAEAVAPSRAAAPEAFRVAYIGDAHLSARPFNERTAKALLRAVDDVNAMDPQPDFVVFGGDLSQFGLEDDLELGARILRGLKAPLRMVVGEHDRRRDGGAAWRRRFGAEHHAWDHKGVRCVVLNGVLTEEAASRPESRASAPVGADAATEAPEPGPFRIGEAQRAWLSETLKNLSRDVPVLVFCHTPLQRIYRKWNYWTEDAEAVHEILRPFDRVTVVHGHTHHPLMNRIGNIHFHGMLSTARPLPYAPEGLPAPTVPIDRPNPFNPADGCGLGRLRVRVDGDVDVMHELWNRSPLWVTAAYLRSSGTVDRPPAPRRKAY